MGSLAWKGLATAAAIGATAVAERFSRTAWRAATGEAPPDDPANPDVTWQDAMGWAVLSGVAVASAQLWAKRRAAEYYRNSAGDLPKQFRPEDAKSDRKKKAEKA